MYQTLLDIIRELPPPYATNGLPFWDDDHISKSMLEAHLNPDTDGASRRPGFIEKSVRWIAALCPPEGGKRLIDLGCGPGTVRGAASARAGFRVTGVDFSCAAPSPTQSRARRGIVCGPLPLPKLSEPRI